MSEQPQQLPLQVYDTQCTCALGTYTMRLGPRNILQDATCLTQRWEKHIMLHNTHTIHVSLPPMSWFYFRSFLNILVLRFQVFNIVIIYSGYNIFIKFYFTCHL